MAYTEEEILDRLREHMVDELLSKYSISRPTWQGIAKRMKKDEDFADKVHTIENDALAKWERVGLKALFGDNTDFNTQLFKMYVGSKKSFLPYEVLDLDERIEALEESRK